MARLRGAARLCMTRGCTVMQRFDLQPLQTQHINAKPRIDLVELHFQKRSNTRRIASRPCKAQCQDCSFLIGAMRLQPQKPHTFAPRFEAFTKPGQHSV